jgi:hypothetical protein
LQEFYVVKLLREFVQGRSLGDYGIDYICHVLKYNRGRGGSQWVC